MIVNHDTLLFPKNCSVGAGGSEEGVNADFRDYMTYVLFMLYTREKDAFSPLVIVGIVHTECLLFCRLTDDWDFS